MHFYEQNQRFVIFVIVQDLQKEYLNSKIFNGKFEEFTKLIYQVADDLTFY